MSRGRYANDAPCAWFALAALRLSLLFSGAVEPAYADWPMLRGNSQRTGYVDAELPRTLNLTWVVEFEGERLGTAMEPIVGGELVFLATHSGQLWALDATTGAMRWRFEAGAPLIHSPVLANDMVIGATTDGCVFAVHAQRGALAWEFDSDRAGFAASPLFDDGKVLVGSRGGTFLALEASTGKPVWTREFGVPIRQSAAADAGLLWITGEDLRTHCLASKTGRELWVSPPAQGQSARDYYPVVARRNGRPYVVVRTNPALIMSQRIACDRGVLARNAGVADNDWRKVEAWTTGPSADGTPDLWRKENEAIVEHLRAEPEAQTCFIWDTETGRAMEPAPVLWVGGCQGVPAPPVVLPDGRLFTVYRSAYGHWSHGVAPLVGIGVLDPETSALEPVFHRSGPKPPWNTFWGTADEEQNIVMFRRSAVFVHQGTLSRFDRDTGRLEAILGERDTFGGLPHPAWARNEWHGPARGGVAWSEGRLYWLAGSRVLCLSADGTLQTKPSPPVTLSAKAVPASGRRAARPGPTTEEMRSQLTAAIRELLADNWVPLVVEPGLAGRSVFFADPATINATLAAAWPHTPEDLRRQLLERMNISTNLDQFLGEVAPPVKEPRRREYHSVPGGIANERRRQDREPLAFGNLAALAEWARKSGDTNRLASAWPKARAAWQDFRKAGWRLDPARGDLYANRYLASLVEFARLAQRFEPELEAEVSGLLTESEKNLVAWWERSAANLRLETLHGSRELDPFINAGDGLFFKEAPHRHRLALFQDLTPDLAALLRERAPGPVEAIWKAFERLCPTWWLVEEERQVHSGENFIDPPDFTLSAFQAFAYLRQASTTELAARIDIAAGHADLYRIQKLGIALETSADRPGTR